MTKSISFSDVKNSVVCLQIDPESYEFWFFSEISLPLTDAETPQIAENYKMRA